MYCSNCGKAGAENLNYCSSCGSRNEYSQLIVSNSAARPFAIAAAVISAGGLFGFFPVLKILLQSRLDQAAILIILGAYLVTLFMMFAVAIGHVWKNSGDLRVRARQLDQGTIEPAQASFRSPTTAQLEPVPSVVEHTTRTLGHTQPIPR